MFLEFFGEFDLFLFMGLRVLMSHFNHCICVIDLHPALLFWSGYSGPWRAFDSVYEEVILLFLFEPLLGLLVDSEANCFHFDNRSDYFPIFPVDCWAEGSEPQVS